MKEICLLIVLTHLAFPAFENGFKFQYLGLKGEFRIQPYFLEGISIYLKVNWKINDLNSLSFRYSTQKGGGI